MRLFALKGSDRLGAAVARSLAKELDPHEERDFEDGEHKARPLVSVRGHDVYVVHSLNGTKGASANDKLCKLLFFLATCRENGARSVSAVVPYLAYGRKDRQTKSRDPVTTRYVAQLFEAMGIDRLVTMEAHNFAAFQNAFRCPTVHLDMRRLFCAEIVEAAAEDRVTIFSPDGGGVKRAQLLKEMFEAQTGADAAFGFMEKRRSRGAVSGELFAGDVAGRAVFIIDDMISTGGTMLRAAHACRERGARSVHALATHALFSEGSREFLESPAIDRIVVSDSVWAPGRSAPSAEGRLKVVGVGPLIGDALRRLEEGRSLSDLLGLED